jgi:hypothetical protein
MVEDCLGKILAYRVLQNAGPKRTDEFVRKLYGREVSTHKGRYHYRTRGLLDEIPHRKLIRGVLIVRPEDEGVLIKFLEEYGAEYYSRDIRLTTEDSQILAKTPPTK